MASGAEKHSYRLLLLALVPLAVVALLHGYLCYVLLVRPKLPFGLALTGWILFTLGFLFLPASLWASRQERSAGTRAVVLAGYLWMGAFELLVGYAVVADALALGLNLVLPWAKSHPVELARIEAGLLVLLLALTLPYGVWVARRLPAVERVDIPIRDLPAALDGLRIGFVSDLHIGDTLGERWLEGVVGKLQSLSPDLIAIGGDLVEGPVQDVLPQLAPLKTLRAPLGTFYVTGNHEYYHGGEAWTRAVRGLGVDALQNEHRVLAHRGARFVLAGVPDLEGGRFHPSHACQPERAFTGAPSGLPRILLAHQPRVAKLAASQSVSLQISGHTHAGQMFPFMFFVRLQQPVLKGFHVVAGVPVYTGRGTGYWGPPVRLGAPPEITLLTLRQAAA